MSTNDAKPLIFTVITLFIFFTIISLMPTGLYTDVKQFNAQNPNVYSGFSVVTEYDDLINFTINPATFDTWDASGVHVYYFDLGGETWYMAVTPHYDALFFGVANWFGFVNMGNFPCNFWANGTDRGLYLEDWELNQDYTITKGLLNYEMILEKDPAVRCDTYFSYNTTLYSSPSVALLNEGLRVFIGVGMDSTITAFNAWNLIASIMLFRAPEIFGNTPEGLGLNALIAFPLWVLFSFGLIKTLLWFIPLLGS